jgi:hypothetical protein
MELYIHSQICLSGMVFSLKKHGYNFTFTISSNGVADIQMCKMRMTLELLVLTLCGIADLSRICASSYDFISLRTSNNLVLYVISVCIV